MRRKKDKPEFLDGIHNGFIRGHQIGHEAGVAAGYADAKLRAYMAVIAVFDVRGDANARCTRAEILEALTNTLGRSQ